MGSYYSIHMNKPSINVSLTMEPSNTIQIGFYEGDQSYNIQIFIRDNDAFIETLNILTAPEGSFYHREGKLYTTKQDEHYDEY